MQNSLLWVNSDNNTSVVLVDSINIMSLDSLFLSFIFSDRPVKRMFAQHKPCEKRPFKEVCASITGSLINSEGGVIFLLMREGVGWMMISSNYSLPLN